MVFDADAAERAAAAGEAVILVRVETSPEDIHGMHAAKGILTARGGMTSHAAVVARGMGRPCVSGAGSLSIDNKAKLLRVGSREVREGDILTLDGSTGEVMVGAVATVQPELAGDFGTLMEWADQVRRLKVRANAETPLDCQTARDFGAEGVGLCRTEHMFFDAARITAVRQMILATDEAGRRAALAKLLPEQRADFTAIFEVMAGLPVTVRLLDPPLHEFLPQQEAEFAEVATAAGVDVDTLKRRANELHEFNPMLGHRGCRLGVTYPEIYEIQARAIFEAALDVAEKSGEADPRGHDPAGRHAPRAGADEGGGRQGCAGGLRRTRQDGRVSGRHHDRAAARRAEGGRDRRGRRVLLLRHQRPDPDHAGRQPRRRRALPERLCREGHLRQDPFVSLDVEGVGELVSLAAERGRATRPGIKLGICGEHGGDPASIAFCESVGLDYVSASPYRVPIARLAAAQAALKAR